MHHPPTCIYILTFNYASNILQEWHSQENLILYASFLAGSAVQMQSFNIIIPWK